MRENDRKPWKALENPRNHRKDYKIFENGKKNLKPQVITYDS